MATDLVGKISSSKVAGNISNQQNLKTSINSKNNLLGNFSSDNLKGNIKNQTDIKISMQSTGIYITSITQDGNIIYIHLSNGKTYHFAFTGEGSNSIAVNGTIIKPIDGIIYLTVPSGALADKNKIEENDLDSTLSQKIFANTSIDIATISNNIITLKSQIIENDNLISNGNNNITFSKIASTGKVSDLIQEDNEILILDCGGAE